MTSYQLIINGKLFPVIFDSLIDLLEGINILNESCGDTIYSINYVKV